MGMSLVGLSFSLVLYALDRRQGRVLDMPSAEIAAAASAIKAETLFEGGGGRPSATERESERLLPPDADTASFLSFTSSSGAGVATDGHNEIYDNDEDLVPKVVADGHVILAPATYIHHHHHHHTAVNNTSPIASHDSIHSAGASSSTSGSQNCLGSAGSSSRGRQSSAVTCSCYINNGGLEPNEQGNFCKTHRRTDHASKSRRRPSSSSSRSRSRGRI